MMIAIAAQPDAFTQQPVRDIKTQGLGIKIDHSLQMRGAERQVLQGMWMQARPPSFAACRRESQEIIRGNRNLNADPVRVIKPARVTYLSLAVTRLQRQFDARLVEARGESGEFSIFVHFERDMINVWHTPPSTPVA